MLIPTLSLELPRSWTRYKKGFPRILSLVCLYAALAVTRADALTGPDHGYGQ